MKVKKELNRIASAVETLASAPAVNNSARDTQEKARWSFTLAVRRSLFVSQAKSDNAVKARRASPIMAYVGPNGGGKSLAMVADTLPSLDRGRTVLSTVRLVDWRTGLDHPSFVPFEDWDQLLEAENCDILMDEMVGIAGARESQRLDPRVQNILVQLRRRNIVLRWSAPNWARADKIVREVTQSVTECRGSYSDQRIVRTTGDADAVQLWAPKRLFSFRTYDTMDFEEWSAGKREKLTPSIKETFYGPDSLAFRSYNTLDPVTMVSSSQDGLCDVCGKLARKEYCKGHTAAERSAGMIHLPGFEHAPEHGELVDA